jgi:hypothetical protein
MRRQLLSDRLGGKQSSVQIKREDDISDHFDLLIVNSIDC